jgi:hypothetical protein
MLHSNKAYIGGPANTTSQNSCISEPLYIMDLLSYLFFLVIERHSKAGIRFVDDNESYPTTSLYRLTVTLRL